MTLRIQVFLMLLCGFSAAAQPYSSWRVGAPTSIDAPQSRAYVLAGGGGDNDDAMRWMLQRANGGDVLVLRTTGSNGYNNYFFSELGVSVNSVETLRLNGAAGAAHPYVLQRVSEAEVVFIAGGDQWDYYQYWRNSPLGDSLRSRIAGKGLTLGGTSAGMMIMGEVYYAPQNSGVTSPQALTNPYHPNMNVLGKGDFLNIPIFEGVIMDSHYEQREREGRHVAFLARMEQDWGMDALGIACNEYTAVCVDESGVARVFGEAPQYPDYAFFIQSNCAHPASAPEVCAPGLPLQWHKGEEALKVCKIPGTPNGANTFNLNDWLSAEGGVWEDWHAEGGLWKKKPALNPPCFGVSAPTPTESDWLQIGPVPAREALYLRAEHPWSGWVEWYDMSGRLLGRMRVEGVRATRIGLGDQDAGMLVLRVLRDDGQTLVRRAPVAAN
ncbi:MAG: cyanophycinase [Saprospiraceae bacterium]